LNIIKSNLLEANVDEIAVVSVMGLMRTGKSLLLNFIVKYLEANEDARGSPDVPASGRQYEIDGKSTYPVPKWLRETESMGESSAGGFHFRGGDETATQGIYIYPNPFVQEVENADGTTKRIGVLLMDTQGAHDGKTIRDGKDIASKLFGLTTVMSSKQIYNVKERLNDQVMDSVRFFGLIAEQAISGKQ